MTSTHCWPSTGCRSGTGSGCAPPTSPSAASKKNAGRTKVIPRLMDERAALKLVFATMIRAADRWCRVSITDLERHQLRLLRAELGLDPPAAADDAKPVHRKRAAA
jgi:hypothetical protein